MGFAKRLNASYRSKNIKPPAVGVFLISRFPGSNRHSRRGVVASALHAPAREARRMAAINRDIDAAHRAAKVEKRVLRATTRRIEREEAKKKGVPVNYSIA